MEDKNEIIIEDDYVSEFGNKIESTINNLIPEIM